MVVDHISRREKKSGSLLDGPIDVTTSPDGMLELYEKLRGSDNPVELLLVARTCDRVRRVTAEVLPRYEVAGVLLSTVWRDKLNIYICTRQIFHYLPTTRVLS
jgi:hypothetical protein